MPCPACLSIYSGLVARFLGHLGYLTPCVCVCVCVCACISWGLDSDPSLCIDNAPPWIAGLGAMHLTDLALLPCWIPSSRQPVLAAYVFCVVVQGSSGTVNCADAELQPPARATVCPQGRSILLARTPAGQQCGGFNLGQQLRSCRRRISASMSTVCHDELLLQEDMGLGCRPE